MIDFISDFHVEMNLLTDQLARWKNKKIESYQWADQKKSDSLIIAGDVANNYLLTIQVIMEAKQYYDRVIFVDGNHEHYSNIGHGLTVSQTNQKFIDLAQNNPGIHYLNGKNHSIEIDGTLIIGFNGWYNFLSCQNKSRDEQHAIWKEQMNDRRYIRFDKYPDIMAWDQAEELMAMVQEANSNDMIKDIIVVTHTVPHIKGVVPPGHHWYATNGSYHNTYMERVWFGQHKIKTWVFGHTHNFHDFDDCGIRFITNPRGYMNEKRDKAFPGLIIL